VLHSGKRRYGAPDVERGQQASLIMWTKSRSYRLTEAYARRCSGAVHDRRLIVVAPLDDQMWNRMHKDHKFGAEGGAETATTTIWLI
jgi:hypothetical protein